MSHTSIVDSDLNKAALVIAKLLLRTREGKVQWERASSLLSASERYSVKLEDDVEVAISRGDRELTFTLSGKPAVKLPNEFYMQIAGAKSNEILSISLKDARADEGRRTPEGIVYQDLHELFQLASNPKAVSDDLRIKQVMSYLDKLGA